MNLVLPDIPFRVGEDLRPHAVVDDRVVGVFSRWLGDGLELKKLSARATLAGHYKVSAKNNRYFVRVLPNAAAEHARAVQALSMTWAPPTPVIRALDAEPVPLDSEHVALRYDWFEGKHPESDGAQLFKLGQALAYLHGSMAASTEAARVASMAAARTKYLAERYQRGLPPKARSVLEGCPTQFDRLDSLPAGPLHGDLNPGNVLVSSDNEAIVFCDFEDAIHTYGPPIFDLAFIVERVCLDADNGIAAAAKLFEGYCCSRKVRPVVRQNALFDAISLLNFRAVIIMVLMSEAGLSLPDREWAKFSYNVKRLRRAAGKIAAIEQAAMSGAD